MTPFPVSLAHKMTLSPEVFRAQVDSMTFEERIHFMAGMVIHLSSCVSSAVFEKAIQAGLETLEREVWEKGSQK